MENMPPDESTDDLSERLRSAYETERAREVALAKRQELQQVAAQNQLVILRGTFEAAQGEDGRICVRLTYLEPSEVVAESAEIPEAEIGPEVSEMPMPEDVGVEAVLPLFDALTSAGHERLNRGAPFYGRLIGHSASFNDNSGVLDLLRICRVGHAATSGDLAYPRQYEFLEGR